jgi:hypothetical protein
MRNASKCLLVGLFVVGLTVLCGCAEKLTYKNWRTLDEGVVYQDDVVATLGTKHLLHKSDEEMTYSDTERGITATFEFDERGKLVRKLWSQAGGTVDEGSPIDQPGDENMIHRETNIRTRDQQLD